MIESGSLTPGVRPADFGLPDGTALRVEMPDRALRPMIGHYLVFDSEERHVRVVNRALPSNAMLRFILTDKPISVKMGNRRYDPLPPAALYGSTGRARIITSSGGISISVALNPLGWARLFPDAAADTYRDQIVPLDRMLGARTVVGMMTALRRMESAAEVKPVLDALLAPLLSRPHPREAEIARLEQLLARDDIVDVGQLAQEAGMTPVALRRLSTRFFGFPSKTLLLRTRFLRSFVPMVMGHRANYRAIGEGYFDSSHFLRDAARFLGVTPRRFLDQELGYVAAVVRGIAIVTAADAATHGHEPTITIA